MKPLEMIAEWRKGCTVAGPMHHKCFPDGEPLSAGYCVECTEGLIEALERVLREPNIEMLAEAEKAGGECDIGPQGGREIWRAMTGANAQGCASCGALPIRDNLDGDDLCQACCDKWARGEGRAAQEEA